MSTAQRTAPKDEHGWGREARDLVRGLSGGFLFGIPFLYTMEVWHLPAVTATWRAALFLIVGVVVNYLLGYVSGFRRDRPHRPDIFDAVEAVGLGVIAATASLVAIDRISLETPISVALAMVAFEAIPFSIGVGLANSLLSADRARDGNEEGPAVGAGKALARDIGATALGALFVCGAIAPTDEIELLATGLAHWRIAVLVLFTLVVSYLIVFEAGFADYWRRLRQRGPLQGPLPETTFAYLLSVATGVALLWLFGRIELTGDWWQIYSQAAVIGLPAAIGGAAGRLVA